MARRSTDPALDAPNELTRAEDTAEVAPTGDPKMSEDAPDQMAAPDEVTRDSAAPDEVAREMAAPNEVARDMAAPDEVTKEVAAPDEVTQDSAAPEEVTRDLAAEKPTEVTPAVAAMMSEGVPGQVAAPEEIREELADVDPTALPHAAVVDLAPLGEQAPHAAEIAGGDLVVGAPFATWVAAYGRALCGDPVSGVMPMDGGEAQYFENLALFASADGSVRPLPIGEAAMRSATADAVSREAAAVNVGPAGAYPITDVTATLAKHPTRRYATRPLAQIRHLVIHHTGTSAPLGPNDIAKEHVEANGWPGIGYHFVIDARGGVAKTQDLTTETYHVRQFNPASVGIALAGDFTADVPAPSQIEAAAFLLADLLRDLGLPPGAIRGHREMVATPCPGDAFLTLWKPRLLRLVEARLAVVVE